ncbi:MAG: hypothetical protein MMC33_004575 [Icmadophila ericetorum]|nr:hypothetical protein [Icmadophila ericetorum]
MPALPIQKDALLIQDDVSRWPGLRIEDLSSQGAKTFLQTFDISTMIPGLIDAVFKILIPEAIEDSIPPICSIKLVLEDFDGIAFVYIAGTTRPETRESQIIGVFMHEMVHLWQWNGQGKASRGLIEGVADWVRLKAGFAVPHWRKRTDGAWDMGYDGTAYFLDGLELYYGKGFVVRLNRKLREEYVEGTFWEELCGVGNGVDVLWREYGKTLD